MFWCSTSSRGRERFPNPVLIIGVVGLLLSLHALPSDAIRCYQCGIYKSCEQQEEKECDAKKTLCAKVKFLHDGKLKDGKQCQDDFHYKQNVLPNGFLGCKKVDNSGDTKEICLCDTDLCNEKDDDASYPVKNPGGTDPEKTPGGTDSKSNGGNINGPASAVALLLGCVLLVD